MLGARPNGHPKEASGGGECRRGSGPYFDVALILFCSVVFGGGASASGDDPDGCKINCRCGDDDDDDDEDGGDG